MAFLFLVLSRGGLSNTVLAYGVVAMKKIFKEQTYHNVYFHIDINYFSLSARKGFYLNSERIYYMSFKIMEIWSYFWMFIIF